MTDPLPYDLRPMKAISGTMPDGGGWAYEIKWDGMRVLTFVDDGIRLFSANGIDVTHRFPELHGLADELGGQRAVLDGEVVALGADGRSDFGQLQRRMHIADPAEARRRASTVPLTYMAFDLLHLGDHPTLDLVYEQRRALLHELVDQGPSWQAPRHLVGEGPTLLEAAAERGLEGLVAKRVGSRYEPGRRSPAWRKLKVRRQQEVVVGGWTDGTGTRSSRFGALLVGVHRPDDPDGPLEFAGGVGTGFTDETLDQLLASLTPLATDECPFDPSPPRTIARAAHWVAPELVAQVAFGEWTVDGHLRHPSYLGLRYDKAPSDVVREPG
ncbi:MAG: polymerase LigD, ligase domain protein [Acidimicrobiales bacterium]|nr:polymerase LigD, ligase domain protein [Acidimicrobiales bacterium]